MSNQLINFFDNGAAGFNRLADFVKTLGGGDSEMPLAEVLIVSRVLFAIVMVGFIGHFFDKAKQSLNPMESKAKTDDRQGR
jgi:hypothetical protein